MDGDRYIPKSQAYLGRYTTYSDIVDLADGKIRLVGPFDFEAVDANNIDSDARVDLEIHYAKPDNIYVRDIVPTVRWIELSNVLKGRNMPLPIIEYGNTDTKVGSPIGKKKIPERNGKPCYLCGKNDSIEDGLQASSAYGEKVPIIEVDEVTKLVKSTLESIRKAPTATGEVYCVVDELRAQLNKSLDKYAKKNNGINSDDASSDLDDYNGISKKRKMLETSGATKFNNISGYIYNGRNLGILAQPAAPHLNISNLPDGWTVRKVPRPEKKFSNSYTNYDNYYFSPEGRRFRSKNEVLRFLGLQLESEGNEADAAKRFQNEQKEKGRI